MPFSPRTLTAILLSHCSALVVQSSDAELAAFWNFESGRRGTDLWTTHLHGEGTTPNCYDELGGIKFIESKNAFFMKRFGLPSLSVVNAADEGIPAFEGEHVLKATVFNDETAYLDYAESIGLPRTSHTSYTKARIDPAVPTGNFRLGDGESAWFGFAFYLPTDYVFETADWGTESICELQYREDIPPGASAKGGPFGLAVGAGKLHVGTRFSPTDNPKQSTERKDFAFEISRGRWHTIVCHVRFDFTPNGYAEVWLDGRKIVDEHGLRIGYQAMQQAKAALDVMTNYKHNWWAEPANTVISPSDQFERSIYYDALRVAAVDMGSYADVAPRSTATDRGKLEFEAESGRIIGGGWDLVEDPTARTGRYARSLLKKERSARLVFPVNFPRPGRYRVWLRCRSSSDHDNDCYIMLDGEPAYRPTPNGMWAKVDGLKTNHREWAWESQPKTAVHLDPSLRRGGVWIEVTSAGPHELQLASRSENFAVDSVVLIHEDLPQTP